MQMWAHASSETQTNTASAVNLEDYNCLTIEGTERHYANELPLINGIRRTRGDQVPEKGIEKR